METNQFVTNPIKIIKWSKHDNKWTNQTFVILGPRSSAVVKEITKKNKKSNLLREEFGTNYTQILEFDSTIGGSDTIDISEFVSMDDIEYNTKSHSPNKKSEEDTVYIYDMVLFPEDKISDLKYKINKFFGIPMFRQHLWYTIKDQGFPLKYILYQAGSIVPINMTQDIINAKESDLKESILGIPVNMFLYKNKDQSKIESFDQFTLLGEIYRENNILEYNLVDLDTFINPIRGDLSQLSKNDKYQLSILYHSFILKYYPQLNLAAFEEYIDEPSLSASYPQLEPSMEELKYIDKQQELMNELYNLYSDYPDEIHSVDNELQKSLTTTTMKISSHYKGKIINFRVLFDLFELTPVVDAMKLYDIYDARHIILDKYYEDHKKSNEKMIPGVLYMRVIVSQMPYQKLNLFIYPNGAYAVESSWNEELMYQFDNVNHIVHMHITPVIKKINSFKNAIMYMSEAQLPYIDKSNIKYIDISMSIFWKHAVSSELFKSIRHILDEFVAAHIIQEKQVEKNMFTYFFKKGMYELEAKRIEKQSTLDNYYAYLFNSDIRQKWYALFENIRVLSVVHRFSDVKFDISGIKEDEYHIFIRYIILLFVKFKQTQHIKDKNNDTDARMKSKPLNSLKEQDPELYNLKRHGSSIVFSKICQKPFQPSLLTEEQYNKLSGKSRDSIVKYWNFTTNTSAYYQCPNAKLPYIRFITDKHPKGYCIPCCKKTPLSDNENDKQHIIYNTCLQDGKCTKKDIQKSSSRYIMSYGKPIDIGRLSHLPETTLEPLFYDAQADPEQGRESDEYVMEAKYYLYGIPQNYPNGANSVGYLYALANSLSLNLDELVRDTIGRIKKFPNHFHLLLSGKIIQHFVTYKDLCQALYNAFISHSSLSDLDVDWNLIFIDIALLYYEINTIVFEDRDTVIQLRIPDYMTQPSDFRYINHKHLIVLYNYGSKHWNPIYIIHKDIYFRTGIIDSKLYNAKSEVVQLIVDIIKHKFTIEIQSNKITFNIINSFIATTNYKIKTIYVTYDNLCYAIAVDGVGYIPIHLSYIKFDDLGIDISFSAKDIQPAKLDALDVFMNKYNLWVAKESEKSGYTLVDVPVSKHITQRVEPIYPYITVEKWLITSRGTCCGFLNAGLNYYIQPISVQAGQKHTRVEAIMINYDPLAINQLLETHMNNNRMVEDERVKTINIALYNKYSYNLLLLEFIQYFNHQRNTKLRNAIKKLIARTNFQKSIHEFFTDVNNLISQYSGMDPSGVLFHADIDKVKSFISEFVSSGKNKKVLLEIIDNDHFNFDNMHLEQLKKMPKNQIKEQLYKIASSLVDTSRKINTKQFEFPNILSNCSDDNDYCTKHGLVLSKSKLNEYLSIMSEEMKNPFVEKYMFSPLFIDTLVDYFKFIKRPNETVEIEFL